MGHFRFIIYVLQVSASKKVKGMINVYWFTKRTPDKTHTSMSPCTSPEKNIHCEYQSRLSSFGGNTTKKTLRIRYHYENINK